ncbi:hypothetical protein KUF71_019178 [Frankliniella fusca]|uniref:Uncharacterized protein n=1 Tax=Frankliniella fusca TaxID=407009 RepID=A0AAE1GTF8_9NEOP|nr:hypothetical protein KUF71_019178 [Frankliniella fusca]
MQFVYGIFLFNCCVVFSRLTIDIISFRLLLSDLLNEEIFSPRFFATLALVSLRVLST